MTFLNVFLLEIFLKVLLLLIIFLEIVVVDIRWILLLRWVVWDAEVVGVVTFRLMGHLLGLL